MNAYDSSSAGPVLCNRLADPRTKPVPIAPPIAIICTCRLANDCL